MLKKDLEAFAQASHCLVRNCKNMKHMLQITEQTEQKTMVTSW